MYRNAYTQGIANNSENNIERFISHMHAVNHPIPSAYTGGSVTTHMDQGYEQLLGTRTIGMGITDNIRNCRNLNEVLGAGKRAHHEEEDDGEDHAAMAEKIAAYGSGNNFRVSSGLGYSIPLGGISGLGKKCGKGIGEDLEDAGGGFLSGLLGGKKRVKKEKGGNIFSDIGEIAGTVAGIAAEGGKKRTYKKKGGEMPVTVTSMAAEGGAKRKRQTKKDKEDERLAAEIEGLKGKGILDTAKTVIKRASRVAKSGANIIQGKHDLKDLAAILTLGKSGGKKAGRPKKGGNATVSEGAFPTDQEMVEKIRNNGGTKPLKKTGGKLLFREEQKGQTAIGGAKKSPWLEQVAKVRKEHPHLRTLKDISAFIKGKK